MIEHSERRALMRVVVCSDLPLDPAEWNRRGITILHQPIDLARLFTDPPAAIVLDLGSDQTEYAEVAWQLRDLLGVPVIILTEGATSLDVAALLERGAEDVVTDSLNTVLLAARVAAILRRTGSPDARDLPDILRLDDVEIDMARRVVHRPDGDHSMSRTEFNLLLALWRAKGRACTRQELITRVWGIDCLSGSHYLRLYVRYLRQKIEADARRPHHILNVWGVGYRLAIRQEEEVPARDHGPPAADDTMPRGVAAMALSACGGDGRGSYGRYQDAAHGEGSWTPHSSSPRPARSTRNALPDSWVTVSG